MFECKFCSEEFESNKGLNSHMKIHKGDQFRDSEGKCIYCGHVFSFRHLLTHLPSTSEKESKEIVKVQPKSNDIYTPPAPELFRFKLLKKLDNLSLIIFGPRRSGKTFMTKAMISYLKMINNCDIHILKGSSYDDEYKPFKVQAYDPAILQEIVEKQKIDKTKRTLVVLDDVSYDRAKTVYSTALQELYLNGRHLNMDIIVVCHSLKTVDTQCRTCADFIIISNIMNSHDLEMSYEHVNQVKYPKKEFMKIAEQTITIDHDNKIYNQLAVDPIRGLLYKVDIKKA